MSEEAVRLMQDLSDPASQRRLQAVEHLLLSGEAARAAFSLARLAADADEQVREAAVSALEDLGSPPTSDLEELISLLDAPQADVAYWGATLLGRLGQDAAPATRKLASTLGSHAAIPVRERAAWALGKIGPAAAEAIEALEAAAEESQPRLRTLAAQSLRSIRS